MIVRDERHWEEFQWTCKNTSEKLKDEASSKCDRLNTTGFTLFHNGETIHGNRQVKSIQTTEGNPLIAITNRTKRSKNI